MKQSDGTIEVYSEPGVGTSFKIYLPRADQPAPSGKSGPGPGPVPRGTETLLLVEDDDAVRALTRFTLQQCGYTVLEASHGEEAIRVARNHRERIHLLVTDVVMPGMGADPRRAVAEPPSRDEGALPFWLHRRCRRSARHSPRGSALPAKAVLSDRTGASGPARACELTGGPSREWGTGWPSGRGHSGVRSGGPFMDPPGA
ncbi:MAG: response regulator [Gemmatimonadetes bacterium]|nr:response regulator [Gemmatimonadota bacterium]